jgi:branched-chain amino acid aminotransferase
MIKANGFSYQKCEYVYIKEFKDNKWQEGYLSTEDTINISVMSTSLHYGQQAFEGLKAYKVSDGSINLFRVKENAKRFIKSCSRMMMPVISEDEFTKIIVELVKANKKYIPETNKSEALYIRPLMIGVGPKLGVGPSNDYMLIVTVTPVGAYFNNLAKTRCLTTFYDRAAPNGTGMVKVGPNYGSSLYALSSVKALGYNDAVFLDPLTHTKIEEVGAANFFGITYDNKYITPKSNSILPSITNDSLKVIARDYLSLEVIEEDVYINDLKRFKEASACGTGALITPISSITHLGEETAFLTHDKSLKLKEILTNIQYSLIPDKYNWITKIKL